MTGQASALPRSGPAPGDRLAAFIVDDVTGEFPGERLCYVCHYGDRPAALVFAREPDEELARLCRDLDDWIDRHPEGRAFVAVPTHDPEGDAEALRELADTHRLRLPLTLCSEGEFGPHLYHLHPRVPITVLLYREKQVAANLTGTSSSEPFRARVLAAAEALLPERPL